jgi:ubiquinone biosynthesis protein UbiJ
MSEQARIAYQAWKQQHKIDMQVRTDEQMFVIGFEQCQDVIKELSALIMDMEKEHKRLNTIIQKLKKDAKKV